MSSIFEDGAGNKYLGDCRWGNHDINYPTTNHLNTGIALTDKDLFRDDLVSMLTSRGYTDASYDYYYHYSTYGTFLPGATNYGGLSNLIQATSPMGRWFAFRNLGYVWPNQNSTPHIMYAPEQCLRNNKAVDATFDKDDRYSEGTTGGSFTYAAGAFNDGFWFITYRLNTDKNTFGLYPNFMFWSGLVNVNTNFSYYTPTANHGVGIVLNRNIFSTIYSSTAITGSSNFIMVSAGHNIVGVAKDLLQTGRAAYSIDCSDGQTPGAQWATDMWVYDNNAALGYPVIGRVPNMLLGVGSYTYLKPVKIQGSVFPDNGSPWYLPVGNYAGKVLLMRCYSSMT